MQLFSIPEVNKKENNKQAESISQIAYLTITLSDLQKRINIENTNFNQRMIEQRELYTKEKLKLQDELKQLEKKISKAEAELVESLLPIDELEDRAKETIARTQEKAISLMSREEKVHEDEQVYDKRLKNIETREEKLKEKESLMEISKKELKEEKDAELASHQKLNKSIEEFNLAVSKKNIELQEKENALNAIERCNREYIEEQKKFFFEKERAYKDKREALDRAFQEVEHLKLTLTNK